MAKLRPTINEPTMMERAEHKKKPSNVIKNFIWHQNGSGDRLEKNAAGLDSAELRMVLFFSVHGKRWLRICDELDKSALFFFCFFCFVFFANR